MFLCSLKIDSSAWVRNWCVLTVQIPGMVSQWGLGCYWNIPGVLEWGRGTVRLQRSSGRFNILELTGNKEVWLEKNQSQDCTEPISHNLTFHSILVGEGEAFWSQPKVEEPQKFWLVAYSLCFIAKSGPFVLWFPIFCFQVTLTHVPRNGSCWFQN